MSETPSTAKTKKRPYLVLLPLFLITLVAAIIGGLGRAGLPLGFPDAASETLGLLVQWHGPLMVLGFFSAVIALERAVALGRPWGFLGPIFMVAGTIALFVTGTTAAAVLWLAGSLTMLAGYAVFLKRQSHPAVWLQTLAVLCLIAGIAAWYTTGQPSRGVDGWMLFLIWTIVGERLDLNRFLGKGKLRSRILYVLFGLCATGLGIGWIDPLLGARIIAVALVATAIWLLQFDLARRTILLTGLTKYIAAGLLSGFVWLAVGAMIRLHPLATFPGMLWYDASLHAVFLGFVFAMVFAHAPVILPAVSGKRVLYTPWMYLPLVLLNLSLIGRLIVDVTQNYGLRPWLALGNAVSLVLFVVVLVSRVRSPHKT